MFRSVEETKATTFVEPSPVALRRRLGCTALLPVVGKRQREKCQLATASQQEVGTCTELSDPYIWDRKTGWMAHEAVKSKS